MEIGAQVGGLLSAIGDQPVSVLTSAAEPDRSVGHSVLTHPRHCPIIPNVLRRAQYLPRGDGSHPMAY